MNPTPCCPKCGTPVIVPTPGGQGPQGPVGMTGATGATGATGPQGLVWLGAWSSSTAYVPNNAVYYNNSAWVCLVANTNEAPVAGTYWSLLALGQTGATGPTGTISLSAAYGNASTAAYVLTTTPALLALNPTSPSLALAASGTYIFFARARFDGDAASTSTQTLTTYLYDSTNNLIIPNTQRFISFGTSSTFTGTYALITTPPVEYSITSGVTVQLWGFLNTSLGAGTVYCAEADLVALKID